MCHGRWLEVPELCSKERQEERRHRTMYTHRYCTSERVASVLLVLLWVNTANVQITNGSGSCRVTSSPFSRRLST
ncbi:hypothetical protein BDN71DRAFT_1453171, partial [Pleurotus eryngii]